MVSPAFRYILNYILSPNYYFVNDIINYKYKLKQVTRTSFEPVTRTAFSFGDGNIFVTLIPFFAFDQTTKF